MITRHRTGLLLLAAALGSTAQAADPVRGHLLYDTFCFHCHMSEIHYRAASEIDSWARLRRTVAIWQGEMNLLWSEEEVRDVASYLNQRYYHLPVRGTQGN